MVPFFFVLEKRSRARERKMIKMRSRKIKQKIKKSKAMMAFDMLPFS